MVHFCYPEIFPLCYTQAHDGSLLLFGKKAFIQRDPYGLCLIIGSWNYPIQLPLMGLIGAIATGKERRD